MGHYFTNEDIKSEEKLVKAKVLNKEYSFITDNGVFSKDFLDYGTKVLLETITINEELEGNILDVGCGYGGLGICLASTTNKIVEMVDVNLRALELCKRNSELNEIGNIKIYESDIYKNVNQRYSTIVTNPPIRAGKSVVHQILLGAYEYLVDGGELFIVIKKQHGAKSAMMALNEKFSTVEVLKKDKGYFIVKCEK